MSKIKNPWIDDNAVDEVKIRLKNDGAFRARNAGDTADVELFKLDSSDVFTILRELSMSNQKITNLADPTAATDAATKQYVDSVVSGLSDPKESVRVATTGALPAATYANGTNGTGATLTGDANGALPNIDGVGLSVGQRVLVKDQADPVQNGIYTVTVLGDAGTPFELTRATDADIGGGDATLPGDASRQVTQGMFALAAEGSLNGGLGFILTTADPISLGTSGLTFAQFGETILAGQGLLKTGSTLSIDNGVGLGFIGNQLVVLVDNDLVDGTTKIGAGDVVAGRRTFRQIFTLLAGDITNGYVDLAKVASRDSIILQPDGGPKQNETLDFTVKYTGGASSKTRVSFIGDLADNNVVKAGDVLYINHESLDY
jgi:hypothetical protein